MLLAPQSLLSSVWDVSKGSLAPSVKLSPEVMMGNSYTRYKLPKVVMGRMQLSSLTSSKVLKYTIQGPICVFYMHILMI